MVYLVNFSNIKPVNNLNSDESLGDVQFGAKGLRHYSSFEVLAKHSILCTLCAYVSQTVVTSTND